MPSTYFVDESLCRSVLPRVWNSAFLTWSAELDCTGMHGLVRQAFDTWSFNANLSITEVYHGGADVSLTAADVPPDTLALASRFEITVNDNICWYDDRAFCHDMNSQVVMVNIIFSLVFGLAFLHALYIFFRRAKPFEGAMRVATWTLVAGIPIIYFGAVLPCYICYDLLVTLTHEVGHVLGIGHSDVAGGFCGCGASATPCGPNSQDTVMRTRAYVRNDACLARDDVDAIRTLTRASCDADITCYDGAKASYALVAVGLVYGGLFALCVVGTRNALRLRRIVKRREVINNRQPPIPRAVPPAPANRPPPIRSAERGWQHKR